MLLEVAENLRKIVESIVGERISYACHYPAKVVKFNPSNQTVDVVCDNTKVGGKGGFSAVPIRYGIPGVKLAATSVPNGTKVVIGFEDSNPSKPYVSSFDSSTVVIELGLSGAQFVALANVVNSNFQDLIQYLGTLTLPVSGATAGPPADLPPFMQDVSATKLKTL
jgi:hypothetical protein